MYFKSFVGGPDKFMMSVKFSFSIIGKGSFFVWLLFDFLLLGIILYPM